jgi:hypothetical protein
MEPPGDIERRDIVVRPLLTWPTSAGVGEWGLAGESIKR